tara:strand:- start:274 stop:489 length:216 start_codon:yes stop_codon:yes gene_type:complete
LIIQLFDPAKRFFAESFGSDILGFNGFIKDWHVYDSYNRCTSEIFCLKKNLCNSVDLMFNYKEAESFVSSY